jgi:NitT/TauT family transport system ATP-binding protein
MNDINLVKIVAQNVTKRFPSRDVTGEDIVALQDINLSVQANEFVTLVGRSGCGKTTFLNIIAGLLRPTEGEVLINGKPIDGPGLDRGMVFQHSALFPWLTTIGNIEFGPLNQGVLKEER